MRHQEHDMMLPLDTMAGMPTNILDQTGKRIARCDYDGDFCAEAAANAAYIIKCVNTLAAQPPFVTIRRKLEAGGLAEAEQAILLDGRYYPVEWVKSSPGVLPEQCEVV